MATFYSEKMAKGLQRLVHFPNWIDLLFRRKKIFTFDVQ